MKRSLKLKLLMLALIVFTTLPVAGQVIETARRQAAELLVKARSAIGGSEKIKSVKSVSMAARFRRDSMLGKLDGTIEFSFLFPDKFISTESLELPIGTITTVSALDGEIAWQNTKSSSERLKFAGYSHKDIAERKQVLRVLAARWILSLLLREPGWLPFEFSYAGEAETDGKLLNLVDIRGSDGFSARLFLDKTSNRLTMMSYMQKLVDSKTGTINKNGLEQITNGTTTNIASLKTGEVLMHFDDYRLVDGLEFPHRITIESGDGNKESWELTKVQLDLPLAPEVFKEKI